MNETKEKRRRFTGYELSRAWFEFAFENTEKIRPTHAAVFFYACELYNRLGDKENFGLPAFTTMEAIGVRSYNTYAAAFRDLIDWGFFRLVQKSKNQYTANVIALSIIDKATDEATDKPLDKAIARQLTKQLKHNKTKNKEPLTKNQEKEVENRPPSPDLIDEIIELFKNTYSTIRGSQYHVTNKGKERGTASGLLKIFKERHPGHNAEQIKVEMQTFFGKACGVRDDWHYKKMALPHLYSCFNEINTAIDQMGRPAKEGKNLATHPPGPPIRDLSKDPTILKMMKERENLGDTNQ